MQTEVLILNQPKCKNRFQDHVNINGARVNKSVQLASFIHYCRAWNMLQLPGLFYGTLSSYILKSNALFSVFTSRSREFIGLLRQEINNLKTFVMTSPYNLKLEMAFKHKFSLLEHSQYVR